MTTPAETATSEAADAAAEAAAAADAAEAAAAADAAATAETPDPPAPASATVVLVEDDDASSDEATNLDHEQRLTRLEERFSQVESSIVDRPTYDDVRNMIPDTTSVVEAAEMAGAAAGAAAAEAVAETEETGEPASVRIEEPPSGDPVGEVVVTTPEVPEATGTKKRGGLLRW